MVANGLSGMDTFVTSSGTSSRWGREGYNVRIWLCSGYVVILTPLKHAGFMQWHILWSLQGTDGPWTGEFASVFCGSPNVYDDNEGEGSTWQVT